MSKSILGDGLSSGCSGKSLFNLNAILANGTPLNDNINLNTYIYSQTIQNPVSSLQSFINTQNILTPGAQNPTSVLSTLVTTGPTGDTGPLGFSTPQVDGPTGSEGSTGTLGPTLALLYNTTTFEVQTAAKTFVINHPIDNNKYLVHSCLEGPEAGVYYRGKATIQNHSNNITIKLPNYVDKLASDFTVHITPIYNGECILYSVTEVTNNQFTVYGKPGSFSWIVYGKRESIDVEPYKTNIKVMGDGPYKWIQ